MLGCALWAKQSIRYDKFRIVSAGSMTKELKSYMAFHVLGCGNYSLKVVKKSCVVLWGLYRAFWSLNLFAGPITYCKLLFCLLSPFKILHMVYIKMILDYNEFIEKILFKVILQFSDIIRDANFYGLPIVTMENYKNFQSFMDYGKLKFFFGNFFKK